MFFRNSFILLSKFASLKPKLHLERMTSLRRIHVTPMQFKTPDDGSAGGNKVEEVDEEDSEKKDQFLPFDLDTAPKKRILRLGASQHIVKIPIWRQHARIKSSIEDYEGTVGAGSLLSMDKEEINKHLPTKETLYQLFGGIPFSKLPIVSIKASRNNTIMQAFDVVKHKSVMYTSTRKEGFKHAKKKTQLAGQTTGVGAGQRLLRRGVHIVRVVVKGIGPGRMTSVKGLASTGVQVVSIMDFTRLKELGNRPKKIRRV